MSKFLDDDSIVSVVLGSKRAGKSTFSAVLAYECYKKGIPCYSNYAIKHAKKLPTVIDSHGWESVDKNALYDMDKYNSVLLLDEASSIWNARSYNNFKETDSHFFNFLGHTHTKIFIFTQYWDMLDINIKRNCEKIYYIEKSILGFSRIEIIDVDMKKVEILDEYVHDKGYSLYEWKTVMSDRFIKKHMWRPRWYNNFDSYCVDKAYTKIDCPYWGEDFKSEIDKNTGKVRIIPNSNTKFPQNYKWYHKYLKT